MMHTDHPNSFAILIRVYRVSYRHLMLGVSYRYRDKEIIQHWFSLVKMGIFSKDHKNDLEPQEGRIKHR